MTYLLFTNLTDEKNDSFFVEARLCFSEEFVTKFEKYKRWQDAKSTILGRLLLAYGLKNLYQIDIDDLQMNFTKDKKPFIENSAIKFNISHSNDVIVCAITSVGEVGVDVEKINDVNIQDFKGQFSKVEYDAIINSSNELQQFYTYWTQKEAVVKCYGSGLNIPLDSFEIIDNVTVVDKQRYYVKESILGTAYKCHTATNTYLSDDKMEIIKIGSSNLSDFMSLYSFRSFK
ncbi:4'-phosphopantetheinyl transferase superfamily protein [Maribacter sp. M208]|uniref:4'-phosphopantetheinyl transferase family protein n=1 Tax=Maribacter huludaoensis TaxID=3030010 RepID=UPI0023EBBB15|nr:4'-phosphopantetheinyl transferase superfamily protein [Maribacter huludaoensis]MDF4221129.1 4'-phosphopantetheinyl transferase superfamily protein [Maribacter huludaoensis]